MNGFTTAAMAALSLVLAGCATTSGTGAVAQAADAEEAPARPFIERSLVLAPESVGEFRLADINNYPDHPASGGGDTREDGEPEEHGEADGAGDNPADDLVLVLGWAGHRRTG